MSVTNLVGSLDAGAPAEANEWGALRLPGSAVALEWWIGADDRWYRPTQEPSLRRYQVDSVPILEFALRVPGGDALVRYFGAAGGLLVIDVENQSPAPFVFALVVTGGPITVGPNEVRTAGGHMIGVARRPGASASGGDAAAVWEVVTAGQAAHTDGHGEAHALLFPVAHRTQWRAALTLDPQRELPADLARLPSAQDVARGWDRQLERGMRLSVGDRAVDQAVRSARAEILLLAAAHRADPDVFVALEDWGFDDEAVALWDWLSLRHRRAASRRSAIEDPWALLRSTAPPAATLRAARAVLLDDRGPNLDILPGFRADWLGVPVTVEDAPTRHGLVSYALRWHGTRPALLWDTPVQCTLRLPTLAPQVELEGGVGETLLAEPPVDLLNLGRGDQAQGERFEPDSFI